MSKLTASARGQLCEVRVPGVCNGNPETTVAAHYRMLPYCGTGIKPPDILTAYACSSCHDAIDGRRKTGFSRTELRLMHAEGVFRTLLSRATMTEITSAKQFSPRRRQ